MSPKSRIRKDKPHCDVICMALARSYELEQAILHAMPGKSPLSVIPKKKRAARSPL